MGPGIFQYENHYVQSCINIKFNELLPLFYVIRLKKCKIGMMLFGEKMFDCQTFLNSHNLNTSYMFPIYVHCNTFFYLQIVIFACYCTINEIFFFGVSCHVRLGPLYMPAT